MPDSSFGQADSDDAELNNFFSRPIKTQSYTWAIGSTLFETFNPWQDFFENTRVLNRVANYNLLRCKLKVRIVLNGNGFHYGRAIASYTPQHLLDEFTVDRAFFIEDVVAASQRPHVYLDPTNSQGGTLTLPFFHYANALNIPEQEWRGMGDMHIHQMQGLKHANGATDTVTISVFVWAEDVSLSIPTAAEPLSLGPQAGDEYSEGPISKVANSIQKVASRLTDIPVIGMYAKATEIAAGATSSLASLFGYSRPVNINTTVPFTPQLLGNMANSNVKDSSTKLTLDIKQELTVDPRTMGLGSTDEMTISSIAQRESFLTNFSWLVSDSAETLLWNAEVNPVIWSMRGDEIHLPACAFATLPFRWWRGTMKYRFQIVASAFHKGRLKVVYDPYAPTTNEYNTNYTYIIDLAKERDFTVDIGWGQPEAFQTHFMPGLDPIRYSTTASLPTGTGVTRNGIISVYVVNDLTVPNSTINNDIQVNVFVSAGDDFEVNEPDSSSITDLVYFNPDGSGAEAAVQRNFELTAEQGSSLKKIDRFITEAQALPLSAQSGEEAIMLNQPDSDLTKKESEPMKQESSEQMAVALNPMDKSSCVFFGDPITSFRQCLKRYGYHSSCSMDGNSLRYFIFANSDFPYYRGYAPGGVNLTSLPVPSTAYNYAKMTLLNYITPAFTARRGGLRWKYFRNVNNLDGATPLQVSRNPSRATGYAQVEVLPVTGTGSPNAIAAQCAGAWQHFWDGGAASPSIQNPVLEAELPYYSSFRFSPAKQADQTSDGFDFRVFHLFTTLWQKSSADQATVQRYCSVGEDFTLSFFTGAPICYYLPDGSDPVAQG